MILKYRLSWFGLLLNKCFKYKKEHLSSNAFCLSVSDNEGEQNISSQNMPLWHTILRLFLRNSRQRWSSENWEVTFSNRHLYLKGKSPICNGIFLQFQEEEDSKCLETLINAEGKELSLHNNLILYCTFLVASHNWLHPPLTSFLVFSKKVFLKWLWNRREGAGHNLWKTDTAWGHKIYWVGSNGSKMAAKSTWLDLDNQ